MGCRPQMVFLYCAKYSAKRAGSPCMHVAIGTHAQASWICSTPDANPHQEPLSGGKHAACTDKQQAKGGQAVLGLPTSRTQLLPVPARTACLMTWQHRPRCIVAHRFDDIHS